jgi:uncharacterized protein (TIGR00251 family)
VGLSGTILAALGGADGAVRLALRVQPGARSEGLRGGYGAALRLAVRAPAVDGRANEAVVALIARICGLAARDVELVSGHGGRSKVVLLRASRADVVEALARALGEA